VAGPVGDKQSQYLLEQFIRGGFSRRRDCFGERVLFAEAHAYGMPPLDVSHHGGVSPRGRCRVIPGMRWRSRKSPGACGSAGFAARSYAHEFLKSEAEGDFIFWKLRRGSEELYIECGPGLRRESICGASGRNGSGGQGSSFITCPRLHEDFAGVIVSLARQQEPTLPDTRTRRLCIGSRNTITRIVLEKLFGGSS